MKEENIEQDDQHLVKMNNITWISNEIMCFRNVAINPWDDIGNVVNTIAK